MFDNLARLNADLVRYGELIFFLTAIVDYCYLVPWFPYPSVGVAELLPPDYTSQSTSWNFTNIIPQLSAFMNATYGQGHQV